MFSACRSRLSPPAHGVGLAAAIATRLPLHLSDLFRPNLPAADAEEEDDDDAELRAIEEAKLAVDDELEEVEAARRGEHGPWEWDMEGARRTGRLLAVLLVAGLMMAGLGASRHTAT